jgi:hypothetical protein
MRAKRLTHGGGLALAPRCAATAAVKWLQFRSSSEYPSALHTRLPGHFHPQLRDKNRRDIGKSQSILTDSKMETAGSPKLPNHALPLALAQPHGPKPALTPDSEPPFQQKRRRANWGGGGADRVDRQG